MSSLTDALISPPNATAEHELEIVLLEVKHGQGKLTPVQRAVAAAVEAGRVRFEVAQIDEDGIVSMKTPVSKRPKEIGL